MTETQTQVSEIPTPDPTVEVVVPEGAIYTSESDRRFRVVDAASMDWRSLEIARAFAYGAAKGAVVVIGDDGVETFSPDDFAASSGLSPEGEPTPARGRSSDEIARGYTAIRGRFE